MKCPECGSTTALPYKEFRQYIAESGITKEEVQEMFAKVVESMCRSALSDKLDSYIENAVGVKLRDYQFQRVIESAVKDVVYQACSGLIEVKIKQA